MRLFRKVDAVLFRDRRQARVKGRRNAKAYRAACMDAFSCCCVRDPDMTNDTGTSGLFTAFRSPSNLHAPNARKEANVGKLLCNDQGQLRNGWWILVFLVVFLASQWAYHPVSKALQHLGAGKALLLPLPVAFLLLVTWLCMRLRRQSLAGVGLRLDVQWLRHVLAGIAFGAAQMLLVAVLIYATGGVRFSLDPAGGPAPLAVGAWAFAWVALLEELLFRGFIFQRMLDGIGEPAALLLMAVVFAAAHWGNPGMEGATELWASIDLGLAGMLLGLAYVRTGSLALPIGLHFGWNWMQGSVLGFDVSGLHQAGWLLPHLLHTPQWLSGGAFGPEASVLAVVVDSVAVLLLWRWKGVPSARQLRPMAMRTDRLAVGS
jgi:membrane protease YdiL (CAAX protease family)